MNGILCQLLPLAAPLILMQVGVAPAAAQTSQAVPTLSALSKDGLPLAQRLPRPLSKSEERALTKLDPFRECEHCPEMIVVPGGSFVMGARVAEPGSTADERPQHQVTLRSFAVGRLPVSHDEWAACVAAKGCSFRAGNATDGRGQEPVGNIQWEEAREYVEWLSHAAGRPYRLLSESEREYVARAGTTTAFWWGDAPGDGAFASELGGPGAVPAAKLAFAPSPPNPWGLRDVHGGVYDWVEDCYHDNYDGAPADGSAWIENDCSRHVLRGGSFSRAAQTRRAAARMWFGSPNRMLYMSVRVARDLQS